MRGYVYKDLVFSRLVFKWLIEGKYIIIKIMYLAEFMFMWLDEVF